MKMTRANEVNIGGYKNPKAVRTVIQQSNELAVEEKATLVVKYLKRCQPLYWLDRIQVDVWLNNNGMKTKW